MLRVTHENKVAANFNVCYLVWPTSQRATCVCIVTPWTCVRLACAWIFGLQLAHVGVCVQTPCTCVHPLACCCVEVQWRRSERTCSEEPVRKSRASVAFMRTSSKLLVNEAHLLSW